MGKYSFEIERMDWRVKNPADTSACSRSPKWWSMSQLMASSLMVVVIVLQALKMKKTVLEKNKTVLAVFAVFFSVCSYHRTRNMFFSFCY